MNSVLESLIRDIVSIEYDELPALDKGEQQLRRHLERQAERRQQLLERKKEIQEILDKAGVSKEDVKRIFDEEKVRRVTEAVTGERLKKSLVEGMDANVFPEYSSSDARTAL
jgi:hypothetical protein